MNAVGTVTEIVHKKNGKYQFTLAQKNVLPWVLTVWDTDFCPEYGEQYEITIRKMED